MTVTKLTVPPSYGDVIGKINEVIDNLDSSTGANVDLSNLSSTGETHFQLPIAPSDSVGIQKIMTWTEGAQNTDLGDNSWRDIAYGNGVYVAVANSQIGYSSNGIDWNIILNYNGSSIIYVPDDGGAFVTINSGGRILASEDGENWNLITTITGNDWIGIAYGDGNYVAVTSTGNVATSTDLSTWSIAQPSNFVSTARMLTYGNGKFIAINVNGELSTSTDGENWTLYSSTNIYSDKTYLGNPSWNNITYGNGMFVIIAQDGYYATSVDGINWVLAPYNPRTTFQNWKGLTYDGSQFIAIDFNGYISTSEGSMPLTIFSSQGQWVNSSVRLASTVTAPTSGTTEYSLAAYLPSDGCDYEVFASGIAVTSNTSGKRCIIDLSSDLIGSFRLCDVRTRTSSSMEQSGVAIMPIGKERKIIYTATADQAGTYTLYVLGYRRISFNK